jgi:hypothetical protein
MDRAYTKRSRASPNDQAGVERHSKKNKKQNRHYQNPVFVGCWGCWGGSSQDVADFIESVMRNEGFVHSEGHACILRHHSLQEECRHCLEMATEDLAEKACYLNGLFFLKATLRIGRGIGLSRRWTPKFSSWNEYYLHRYGNNSPDTYKWLNVMVKCGSGTCDPALGDRLRKFLNQNMSQHLLCSGDAIRSLISTGPKNNNSFYVEMESPLLTELLCYFDEISFENSRVKIHRLHGWEGPKPKYRNFRDFKKRGDFFHLFFLCRYPTDWRWEEIRIFLNERIQQMEMARDDDVPIINVSLDRENGCLALLTEGGKAKEFILRLNDQTLPGFGIIQASSEYSKDRSHPTIPETISNAKATEDQQKTSALSLPHKKPSIADECKVYVYHLPSGVNGNDFVNTFANTVKEHGTIDGIEKAIVKSSMCRSTGIHCLTMSSEYLVDMVIRLNNIKLPGFGTLLIGRDPLGSDYASRILNLELPNGYKSKTNQEIMFLIDQKMAEHGLSSRNTAVSRCWRTSNSNKTHRSVEMLNSVMAEKLMYLNGMPMIDGSEWILCLRRHEHFKAYGVAPKYTSYTDFVKRMHTESVKPVSTSTCTDIAPKYTSYIDFVKRMHTESVKPVSKSTCTDTRAGAGTTEEQQQNSPQTKSGTAGDHDALAAVREENIRLKERIPLENENKRLKHEVEALSKSNLEKVERECEVRKQLSTLKDRLSAREQEVAVLEKGNSDLASDLATAQQQLNDVHKSWQEQVSELSLKQIEIDGLNRQVQELQNQSQNDTESLLEERNEKKLATDRIHQLQTDYKELDVSRSRPIDGANKSSAQTSVKKAR